LAYAISIHKSQGLEYDSVKIVITREIEENISHNIFYTAITRAKKYLKIYWSPETQQYIIKNFNIKNNKNDIKILKTKNNI
jgi:putative helicase